MIETPPHNDLCTDYAGPVQRLLTIGETRSYDPAEWLDYTVEFGLGREHIGELSRLACDRALNYGDPDSCEAWAPLHAWRALGQLQAEASVALMLAFLKTAETDEAVIEEFPKVFGMIGRPAIPHIERFLSDRSTPTFPVATAIEGLKEVAERHPDCRTDCVNILTRVLEQDADADGSINGFAVSALIDLAAVEAIDAMREAFRRNSVDISIAGDEEDVEIALGLRNYRSTPAPVYQIMPPGWFASSDANRIQQDNRALPQHGKVGRNDQCPCGSGKKYKKCCLQ
jgi:SEC-C motif